MLRCPFGTSPLGIKTTPSYCRRLGQASQALATEIGLSFLPKIWLFAIQSLNDWTVINSSSRAVLQISVLPLTLTTQNCLFNSSSRCGSPFDIAVMPPDTCRSEIVCQRETEPV